MLHNGMDTCNCKKAECTRHGKCDECVEFHNNSKRLPLPYCKRQKTSLLQKLVCKDKYE